MRSWIGNQVMSLTDIKTGPFLLFLSQNIIHNYVTSKKKLTINFLPLDEMAVRSHMTDLAMAGQRLWNHNC